MTLEIDTTSWRSPNFSPRRAPIDMLVYHSGGGSKISDLRELTAPKPNALDRRVSSHYYIDRAGNVYQLVKDEFEAWHAGNSSWQGRADLNQYSIGIELEHKDNRDSDYPEVQRQALRELSLMLIKKYGIQKQNVVTHKQIAPGRKTDPNEWPDIQAFINSLYLDLDRADWGPLPYYHNYRIPTAWREHKAELGEALAVPFEQLTRTIQVFQGGVVIYDAMTSLTNVYTKHAEYRY